MPERQISPILDRLKRDEAAFKECCNEIAMEAAQATNSEVAVLYLTPDQKILEAVGRYRQGSTGLLLSDIPFYRLDWDVIAGYESIYDGFTAWVTLHLRPGCYDVRTFDELKRHLAHRGRWDPVLWQGEPERHLDRILCTALGVESEDGTTYRCFGLLKVEREKAEGQAGREYSAAEVEGLLSIGDAITEWLKDPKNQRLIGQAQTKALVASKAAEFLSIFSRGRSLSYNITEGIGFITELFRLQLGADHAFHIFEGEGGRHQAVLPYWRPAYRPASYDISEECKSFSASHPSGQPGQPLNPPWREQSVRPQLLRPAGIGSSEDRCEHYELAALPQDKIRQSWENLLRRIAAQRATPGGAATVVDLDLTNQSPMSVFVPGHTEAGRRGGWCEVTFNKAKLIRLLSPGRDLGTVVVPIGEQSSFSPPTDDELAGTASTLARVFDGLLTSQYNLPSRSRSGARVSPIYLPALRRTGPKWVALLFADIRNFSTVTLILRLLGERTRGALELLMDVHTLEMARTISRWGRRDKFMGDGLLAIFGEDLDGTDPANRELMVKCATCCACEMVLVFDELKQLWLAGRIDPGKLPWRPPVVASDFNWAEIQREFNENLELDIAVGINFGQVYFDFFGDLQGREYTPIGDQVNFAKRLEEAAARFDEQLGRPRARILLSQTAWSYAWNDGKGFLIHPPTRVYVSEKYCPFERSAFEVDPKDLNIQKIRDQVSWGPNLFPLKQSCNGVELADWRKKEIETYCR